MSFYSPDFYRESARSWTGIGLVYLLLVLAVSWLPTGIRWYAGLQDFATTTGPALAEQLPTITIEGGIMRASPSGRHVIRAPDSTASAENEVLIIIDDSIDEAPSDVTEQVLLLTRREVAVIRPSRNERRVWTLTPGADMEVSPDDVDGFLRSLPYWMPAIGYAGAVSGSLVVRTLQILLYAAIGLRFAQKWSAGLDYRAMLRLAAVAVTPVIVIRTLIWFGPWEPSWLVRWPIAIAITLAFLRFGIRAAADSQEIETPVARLA